MSDTMTGVTEFTELDPTSYHLVPDGANDFPFLLAKALGDAIDEEREVVKACGLAECEVCVFAASKAKLDSDARNSLSDSDFAYIDSKGGRHLPIHDKAHVRNALARFNQTHFESDEAKASAHRKIVARAKELGVEVSDTAEKDLAANRSVPTTEALSQTPGDGDGADGTCDATAHDGGTPRQVAAQGKTLDRHDGEGDTSPSTDLPLGEAGSQTPVAQVNKADTDTGDGAEKDGASKSNDPVSKEREIDMTEDELTKALGEWEARRASEKKARKEKKAAKAARKAAKAADPDTAKDADASKAAEGDGAVTLESLAQTVGQLAETVKTIAEQPVRGPMLSEAGLAAHEGGAPVLRGPAPTGDMGDVFKTLQERIDNAPNETIRQEAIGEMARARFIAAEKTRKDDPAANRFGPGATSLVTNRHALRDDPQVQGI